MSNSSLATTAGTELANLSPRTQELLAKAQKELTSFEKLPNIPEIRFAQSDDIEGVQEGEFYTVTYEKKEGQNEPTKTIQSIGRNPEIVILKRLYSYSFWSKSQEKLLAWTNEFAGFSENDIVYLVNNREDRPKLEAELPYPAFKKYMQEHYYDEDEGRNKLRFKNALYVSHAGKVYRMLVSNASICGIPEGENKPDYKNHQPLSFIDFERNVKAAEPGVLFSTICKLGSKHYTGKVPFHLIQFQAVSQIGGELLGEMAETWDKLNKDLDMLFAVRFGRLIAGQAEGKVEITGFDEDMPSDEDVAAA